MFFVIYGLPIVRKTVQWVIQRLQPSFSELHFRAAGLPPGIKKPRNTLLKNLKFANPGLCALPHRRFSAREDPKKMKCNGIPLIFGDHWLKHYS